MAPAPFPYAGGANAARDAVGPAWSAPSERRPAQGPHAHPHAHPHAQHARGWAPRENARQAPPAAQAQQRQAPRRVAPSKPGWFRRILSAAFTFVAALVLFAGAGFAVLALLDRGGIVSLDQSVLPVILPEQPIAMPSIVPLTLKQDKTLESTWASGNCGDFSKERDLPAYQVGRDSGSAQALRGKTAALVLKLHAPGLAWTKTTDLNVDRASLIAQRFYLTQAKKRGVDLRFDVIPWALKSAYQLPSLALDANQRLDTRTMDVIRDGSRLAVEGALGARLERVIGELRKGGYQNVALFVFLPVKTSARSFAVPSYRSAPTDYPEAAYLFVPTNDFGHFAVTVAHEGMHLFGADDLYRIKNVDKRDNDDVMGEYCTGFLKATVNDATAFAVGWAPAAPPRGYNFDIR